MQLTITLKIKKKNMNADKIIKKQGGIMLYSNEVKALEDFEKEFGNPHFFKKHKWGDILARRDKELWFETCGYNYEEFKCKVYYKNKIFTHNTVSDRFIIYDYSKLLLTIYFDKEGSSTFAYQVLANLAPLMQPEKWRGLGGGNLEFNGKIKKQFKIYVTF